MKTKIKISVKVLLFLLLTGFSFLHNAGAEVLSWSDCVQIACENNPDLISATAKIDEVRADKSITKSAILPQVSSSLAASKSKSGSREATESYSYSVSAKQLLFDGAKSYNSIKSANINIKEEEYNYLVKSSDVRLTLRTVFAGLLRAQDLVSLTESIAKRRKQNLKMIELRYDAGREHKGSLLTAEADLANAEFEVDQAVRNLSLAKTKMLKVLGAKASIDISVAGDFTVEHRLESKPEFAYLADTTPFLQALIMRKESARLNLNGTKSEFFPKVYLNGSTGSSGSEWTPDEDNWSFGLSVSFPIFEGGRRIAEVKKAKAKVTQAVESERSGRDSVIQTLEETWVSFQDALGTESVQAKYLVAAEERAKIANAQYSTGLISFDDWIIIEDSIVNSKKSYLNAQANVLIAEAAWLQAQGRTLGYEKVK